MDQYGAPRADDDDNDDNCQSSLRPNAQRQRAGLTIQQHSRLHNTQTQTAHSTNRE